MNAKTPWLLLGPDDSARSDRLLAVVEAFYARVVPDPMIGFFFSGKDIGRLIQLEFQFTAAMLGGPMRYEGRGMRQAHRGAGPPIMGGHFERRQQLLREVMAACELPQALQQAWLSHNQALRSKVTQASGTQCEDPQTSSTQSGSKGDT